MRLIKLVAVACIGFVISACCSAVADLPVNNRCRAHDDPPDHYLVTDMKIHKQAGENWCWAASTTMILEHFGTEVAQCDEANSFLRRTPCCLKASKAKCDQPGWPNFGRYGYAYERNDGEPLSWDAIKTELYCHDRPFAFAYQSIDGDLVGHMVVVVGYDETNSNQDLLFLDPALNNPKWPYIQYQGSKYDPDHVFVDHVRDYYKIRPKECR
jgi:hypothetical protein